ncbi:arginine--tRNA ligase [Pseudoclavibacter sp. CFCC 14310]|uniref:arginine--tRNA ligase n=1 Tax=Pseudoclavibacter sp. CFCC 14310 TaxID=2615180 RepID=UPI001300EAFB|nr:arginine--tRNA ligase [Pseudoclavibacter sp. CFCC 14310]KAB1643750.1 arginine--tRNA ligase [Pseudoclavibacter sp. CFCC 14310]
MTPEDLSQTIVDILHGLAESGDVPAELTSVPAPRIDRPKSRDHGDWATNVALQHAKRVGLVPRALAETIAGRLRDVDGIAEVDVAGPGFINVTLDAAAGASILPTVIDQGDHFGDNEALAGHSIDLEFVSANPTGPLHIGHTRWAALGDSIARLLRASGAKVVSEYYINDAGSQMNRFADSVLAAIKGEPTPEGGYPGQYIQDLAAYVKGERPDILDLPADEQLSTARELAYAKQLAEIKHSLDTFNVHFDVWFSERRLHAINPETGTSLIQDAVQHLRDQGRVFEQEGATWVRTSDFGDDKDRVVVRSNGEETYFAADAAYYLDKRRRGYEQAIYFLGADHHGYVNRLKAIVAAAGDDPETNISVLIGQLVNLNGAKLSKRAGNIIELDDLLSWIGSDAMRYWLARYPADSPLNLDGEKLRSRTNDNPVFYVQYAHARTHNVGLNAAAAGIAVALPGQAVEQVRAAAAKSAAAGVTVSAFDFDPSTLTHATETELIAKIAQFPAVVAKAAEFREPHRVARYLEELASDFHRWYDNCRVIPLSNGAVEPVHAARLALNDAAGQVLRNGLNLLGVSAPERM